MGDLILFPQRKTLSREPKGGAAEILFFTGVRYQRMIEPAPTGDRPAQGAKRKRKRG